MHLKIENLKERALILVPARLLKPGDRICVESLYEGIETITDVKPLVDDTLIIKYGEDKKQRICGDGYYRYNEEKDCFIFLSRYYVDLVVNFAKKHAPSSLQG